MQERAEPKAKQILQEYNHWRLFERLPILNFHSDVVNTVAISPDGQTIVSGSHDSTINIWNLQPGNLIRTLGGHSNSVTSVAISADGQTIVSGSYHCGCYDKLNDPLIVWGIR